MLSSDLKTSQPSSLSRPQYDLNSQRWLTFQQCQMAITPSDKHPHKLFSHMRRNPELLWSLPERGTCENAILQHSRYKVHGTSDCTYVRIAQLIARSINRLLHAAPSPSYFHPSEEDRFFLCATCEKEYNPAWFSSNSFQGQACKCLSSLFKCAWQKLADLYYIRGKRESCDLSWPKWR